MKSWIQDFKVDFLYKHWAKMGLILALYLSIFLFSFAPSISDLVFYSWILFPIYLIHQFEEHCLPGKFKEFINHNLFHKTFIPLNEENVFWINILSVWILFPLFAILAQHVNVICGIFLVYFVLLNACIHIVSFLVKRKYNPGLISSLVLFVPIGIYSLIRFEEKGLLDSVSSIIAIGFALFVHFLIASYAIYIYKKKKYTRL